MLRKPLLVLAAAVTGALPLAAAAQYNGDTLLQSQVVVTGTLEQTINSKNAEVGDPFVMDVVPPYPADDPRYQGARVYGHVGNVTRANSTHKGAIELAFDRITLADGTTASLTGRTLSYDAKQGGNSSARGIVGAIVGQIVGNYIGKHIGTDVGGAVGAIGGAIYAGSLGTNITIGQGTTVAMKTTQPSTVLSRRQGYGGGYPGSYNNQPPPPSYAQPAPQGAPPTPYPTPYH
jgi:outer membrane lipoprotein SlyB